MESYIFIVGKSDPQRESARAIRSLGYRVGLLQDIAVPLKDDSAFDSVIPVDFTRLDDNINDIIPSDITAAGLQCTYENYVVAKAKLGAALQLPIISVDAAAASTDKLLMRQAFADKSAAFTPRFTKASSVQDAKDFAATTHFPLIIKPTNLVKSLLVMRCDNEAELVENFEYAQANIRRLYEKYNVTGREPQLIIEEFIEGKSCSIAAFVDHTGTPHFCNGIVSLTTATEHEAADNYLYSRLIPLEIDEAIASLLFTAADSGIRALGMSSTPAHVELMYTHDSVKIIEIGARIGGYRPRMYEYSYGLDLVQQEIRLALGEIPIINGEFEQYCAVFELFPNQTGAFQAVSGDFPADEARYFSIKPQQGQIVGPAKHGYKASAIIIICHDDKEEFARLCKKVDSLTIEVKV